MDNLSWHLCDTLLPGSNAYMAHHPPNGNQIAFSAPRVDESNFSAPFQGLIHHHDLVSSIPLHLPSLGPLKIQKKLETKFLPPLVPQCVPMTAKVSGISSMDTIKYPAIVESEPTTLSTLPQTQKNLVPKYPYSRFTPSSPELLAVPMVQNMALNSPVSENVEHTLARIPQDGSFSLTSNAPHSSLSLPPKLYSPSLTATSLQFEHVITPISALNTTETVRERVFQTFGVSSSTNSLTEKPNASNDQNNVDCSVTTVEPSHPSTCHAIEGTVDSVRASSHSRSTHISTKKNCRFKKIERPTTSLFTNLANSTTPHINQLLKSLVSHSSVDLSSVEDDCNGVEPHQPTMDSTMTILNGEVPMDIDDPCPTEIIVNDDSVDMEIDLSGESEEDVIVVGESFVFPNTVLDALHTVENLIEITSAMAGVVEDDVGEELNLIRVSQSQMDDPSFTALRVYPNPLIAFFDLIKSIAYGTDTFRAAFHVSNLKLLFSTLGAFTNCTSPSLQYDESETVAQRLSLWSKPKMLQKIVSIEELEDDVETSKLTSSTQFKGNTLRFEPENGGPQAAMSVPERSSHYESVDPSMAIDDFQTCFIDISRDCDESVSESVTWEQSLDDSTLSEVPSQSSSSPLKRLKDEISRWGDSPSTETCPLGACFLISLFTAPKVSKPSPLAPKPKSSTEPTTRVQPVMEVAPKKRRATLHPNVLSPAIKKPKRGELQAGEFW